MFGVWLDPDVAGRHVGKSIVAVNDGDDDVPLTPEEEAAEAGAVFFSEGVKVVPVLLHVYLGAKAHCFLFSARSVCGSLRTIFQPHSAVF
jgi:hypothetical protein